MDAKDSDPCAPFPGAYNGRTPLVCSSLGKRCALAGAVCVRGHVMAGSSAAELRKQMGQPDEPGGLYPPSTYTVAASVAHPGTQRVMSGTTTLADNQSASDIAAFDAMTDARQASYVSHTHNVIKNAARFRHSP